MIVAALFRFFAARHGDFSKSDPVLYCFNFHQEGLGSSFVKDHVYFLVTKLSCYVCGLLL